MKSKVTPQFFVKRISSEKKGWEWSIFPLIVLVKYCGIDLTYASRTGIKGILWITFGIIILLLNCASQIFYMYSVLTHLDETSVSYVEENSYQSTTTKWITALDAFNYGVHSILLHVLLFTVVRHRWKHLSESFLRGDELLGESFLIRLRRSSTLGMCLVILEVTYSAS